MGERMGLAAPCIYCMALEPPGRNKRGGACWPPSRIMEHISSKSVQDVMHDATDSVRFTGLARKLAADALKLFYERHILPKRLGGPPVDHSSVWQTFSTSLTRWLDDRPAHKQ